MSSAATQGRMPLCCPLQRGVRRQHNGGWPMCAENGTRTEGVATPQEKAAGVLTRPRRIEATCIEAAWVLNERARAANWWVAVDACAVFATPRRRHGNRHYRSLRTSKETTEPMSLI